MRILLRCNSCDSRRVFLNLYETPSYRYKLIIFLINNKHCMKLISSHIKCVIFLSLYIVDGKSCSIYACFSAWCRYCRGKQWSPGGLLLWEQLQILYLILPDLWPSVLELFKKLSVPFVVTISMYLLRLIVLAIIVTKTLGCLFRK